MYIADAKAMSANYFSLGDKGWRVANYFGDAWVANRAFIDTSVARGQQIFLNEAPLGRMRLELSGERCNTSLNQVCQTA
jgi:hypothetical protein